MPCRIETVLFFNDKMHQHNTAEELCVTDVGMNHSMGHTEKQCTADRQLIQPYLYIH